MLTIRPANADDAPLLMHFVRELARYEKAEHEVLATEHDLRRDLFGPDSRVEALICEWEREPIGHAIFFMNYSTWLGKYGGAGRALLERVAQIAVSRNCGRFEWNVLDWNEPAIGFYESLGAEPLSEWVGYRLEGTALAALGGTS